MVEEVVDTLGRVWHWSAYHSMRCSCYTSSPCFKTLSFRDLKACRGSRVTGRTAGQCKGTGAHMPYGDNWSFVWFSALIKRSCKMWPLQLSMLRCPWASRLKVLMSVAHCPAPIGLTQPLLLRLALVTSVPPTPCHSPSLSCSHFTLKTQAASAMKPSSVVLAESHSFY